MAVNLPYWLRTEIVIISSLGLICFAISGCQFSSSHSKDVNYRLIENNELIADHKLIKDSHIVKDSSDAIYNVGDIKTDDKDNVAKIRTQIAAQYIAKNKLDAAKRQLEKALLANKRYAPTYDMMGVLLQREGSRLNMIKAEQYFQQAIALDPNFMQARNNYGVYLAKLDRNTAAIKQFEIAGSALGYEGRLGALENLGLTALKINDISLASQTFIKVLESNHRSVIAHIELVDILINNDRLIQAEHLYNKMLVVVGSDANKIPRIVFQGIKLAQVRNNSSQ